MILDSSAQRSTRWRANSLGVSSCSLSCSFLLGLLSSVFFILRLREVCVVYAFLLIMVLYGKLLISGGGIFIIDRLILRSELLFTLKGGFAPAKPVGSNGPNGPNGPKGPKGPNGPTGTFW